MMSIKVLLVALLLSLTFRSEGQSKSSSAPGSAPSSMGDINPRSVAPSRSAGCHVIEDHSNHQLWLLTRNPDRPEAPATLIPILPGLSDSSPSEQGGKPRTAISPVKRGVTIIRSGEAVALYEDSSFMRLRLGGIALSTAAVGENITVRLTIGGRPLRAIAIGPGRAQLLAGVNR
jgi:hypothetical protein